GGVSDDHEGGIDADVAAVAALGLGLAAAAAVAAGGDDEERVAAAARVARRGVGAAERPGVGGAGGPAAGRGAAGLARVARVARTSKGEPAQSGLAQEAGVDGGAAEQ